VNEDPLCKFEKLVFRNRLLEEKICFSDTASLCNNHEGVAIYKFKKYEDPKRFSLIREVTYFDTKEHAVFSRGSGCSKTVNDYDEKGNLVSSSNFGLAGEPVENGLGCFMIKRRYDKEDNTTEESYYNKEGAPTRITLGWAIGKIEYKNGFQVKKSLYDEHNQLTLARGSLGLTAVIKNKYDKSGNQTERSFYNNLDNPSYNASGVGKIVFIYSSSGMLSDVYNYVIRLMTFERPEDAAVNDLNGVFHHHFTRDDKGRVITLSQFDKKNMPVLEVKNKAYLTKYRYDDWGRIIRTSFWEDDSTKMVNEKEYHGFTCNYNEGGQITEFNYFDTAEKPVHSILGYSRVTIKYNPTGHAVERKFYIRDTAVTISSREAYASNFHTIRYYHNALDGLESIEYFDEKDQPCDASIKLDNGMAFTAHKVGFNFENGKLLTERFYLAGSDFAVITIDCQKSNFLPADGFGLRIKK
jgi:hypothetical protein